MNFNYWLINFYELSLLYTNLNGIVADDEIYLFLHFILKKNSIISTTNSRCANNVSQSNSSDSATISYTWTLLTQQKCKSAESTKIQFKFNLSLSLLALSISFPLSLDWSEALFLFLKCAIYSADVRYAGDKWQRDWWVQRFAGHTTAVCWIHQPYSPPLTHFRQSITNFTSLVNPPQWRSLNGKFI